MANDNTVELLLKLKDEASEGFEKISGKIDELNKSQKDSTNNTNKDTAAAVKNNKEKKKTIDIAEKLGTAFKTAATYISGATLSLVAFAAQSIQSNKELKELANLAGVSVEEFQRMSYAAQQFGIDSTTVSDALKDMNLKITEASDLGSGAFIDTAKRIGLTTDEIKRLSDQSTTEQLLVLADAFKDLDKSTQNSLADETASDAFVKLLPLLRKGSDEINKLTKEADKLGKVVSEEDINKITKIGVAWENLTKSLTKNFDKGLAESEEEVTEYLNNLEKLFSSVDFASYISDALYILNRVARSGALYFSANITLIPKNAELALLQAEDSFLRFVDFLSNSLPQYLEKAILELGNGFKLELLNLFKSVSDILPKNDFFNGLNEGLNSSMLSLLDNAESNIERIAQIKQKLSDTNNQGFVSENQAQINSLKTQIEAMRGYYLDTLNEIEGNSEPTELVMTPKIPKGSVKDELKKVIDDIKSSGYIKSIELNDLFNNINSELLRLENKNAEADLLELRKTNTEFLNIISDSRNQLNESKTLLVDGKDKFFSEGLSDEFNSEIDKINNELEKVNLLEKLFNLKDKAGQVEASIDIVDKLKTSLALNQNDETESKIVTELNKIIALKNELGDTSGVIEFQSQLEQFNVDTLVTKIDTIRNKLRMNEGDEQLVSDLVLNLEKLKEYGESIGDFKVAADAEQELDEVNKSLVLTGQISQAVSDTLDSSFTSAFKGVLTGATSFKDAMLGLMDQILNAILDVIIQETVLKSIKSGFGFDAFHTGGIVGAGGGGMTRTNISPSVFYGAPKYHNGGIAGLTPNKLKHNEIPAILEKDEEVLTTNNPRHINNYNKETTNNTVSSQNQIIDNRIAFGDDKIEELFSSDAAQSTMIDFINNNKDKLTL